MRNKWNLVQDKLPATDEQVLCWIKDTETPRWSDYRIGHYENNNWYCKGGRKSHEIVERWIEIPEFNRYISPER